jgi:hypothetical protein
LDGSQPRQVFIPLDTDWETVRKSVGQFCKDYKDRHIYFGVATRDGKGGEEGNVKSIPCVWVEMDYKDIPEANIQGIIDKFAFKPTFITKTGGGVHLYFLLDKPVDLKRNSDVRKVNDWIRSELNKLGDCKLDKISDIPRILRLPDTVNHKYDDKPICEIVESNDNSYKLDDLLERIPAPVIKPTKTNETYKSSKTCAELMAQVEYVVKQVEEKKTILGDDSYNDWLRIAFALNDGLRERGRQFFHRVSLFSNKYDKEDCDKQYDKCINNDPPDEKITISTFFFMQRQLA